MDLLEMLKELRTQRDQVEEVIITLERLARGAGKRRGRPPKWMSENRDAAASAPERKRKPFSAETRN